jgi:hypothetical protein
VGTAVPPGQGHRAGYVQLPLGGSRSVNIFSRLRFPGVPLSKKQKQKQKQTPWSESASELYRPSDRRLSAK